MLSDLLYQAQLGIIDYKIITAITARKIFFRICKAPQWSRSNHTSLRVGSTEVFPVHPVKDYEENWGAHHLTLSLVSSENPHPAKEGTGNILQHGFSSSLVLYQKSKAWYTAWPKAEFQLNKNSNSVTKSRLSSLSIDSSEKTKWHLVNRIQSFY